MSSISGVTNAASLIRQALQSSAKKSPTQVADPAASQTQKPTVTDGDHDGDVDGAGGFDKTA